MSCELIITRTAPDDVQQRQVIVKLDHEEIGTLMYGDVLKRTMPPGHHSLTVDNTWVWKTLNFSVEDGEEARFRVINRPGKWTWWLVGLIGAGPMYVTLEPDTSKV